MRFTKNFNFYFKIYKTYPLVILYSLNGVVYANDNNINTDKYSEVEVYNTTDTNQLDTVQVIADRNSTNQENININKILGAKFNKNLYPAQIFTINQQNLSNSQANTLADVVKQDTSVNQNYAPLGYQENFSIRGLALNLDSSYLLNAIPASHRQIPNLANKEQIQVIKGINNLENTSGNGGGAINYITKRPKNIKQVNLHSQSVAQYGISIDIGAQSIYPNQDNINNQNNNENIENKLGYRLNFDYTKLKPYVKSAVGEQALVSLALNGKIQNLLWQFDADYQTHKQYTVPGYQLLGGEIIPLNISPKTMLNNPAWRKPTDTKSYNIGTKLEYALNSAWKLSSNMQYSNTQIDDYAAFPYSFKANGDYKLADYQARDQTYHNKYIDIALNGKFNTYKLQHNLSFGISKLWFDKQGKASITAGKELRNIYNPEIILNPYQSTGESLGDTYTQLKHSQQNIFMRDAINLGDTTLFLGGRLAKLNEQAFSSTGKIATTNKNIFLPNLGLVYAIKPNFGTYIQYSKNIEIGRDADVIGYNSSYLPAKIAKQLELGFNYSQKNTNTKLQGAIFNTSRPYEYVDSNYVFVQDGIEKRRGIELNLSSQFKSLNFGVGATYYLKATQINTQQEAYNNADAQNVPKLQTHTWVEYKIPQTNNLFLSSTWHYSQAKAANLAGNIKIPAYNIFDLGLRYDTKLQSGNRLNLKFAVDNIFNKTYWKDAGQAFGESYIHLGSPRVYKASVSIDFK